MAQRHGGDVFSELEKPLDLEAVLAEEDDGMFCAVVEEAGVLVDLVPLAL